MIQSVKKVSKKVVGEDYNELKGHNPALSPESSVPSDVCMSGGSDLPDIGGGAFCGQR
jgi:hypothetical protein